MHEKETKGESARRIKVEDRGREGSRTGGKRGEREGE
jgi:hypothetical protein